MMGFEKEVDVIRKDRVGIELYTEELLVASEDTAYELSVFRSRHKPHLGSNRAYGTWSRGIYLADLKSKTLRFFAATAATDNYSSHIYDKIR
jgi:hypothetical protein